MLGVFRKAFLILKNLGFKDFLSELIGKGLKSQASEVI